MKAVSNLPAEYLTEFTLKGNGRTMYNIFSQHDNSQTAKKLFPGMAYATHATLAEKFFLLKNAADNSYSTLIEEAFMAHFGRKPQITDYKVSGIYSDNLPEVWKNKIRSVLADIQDYRAAYYVHVSRIRIKDKRIIEAKKTA